MAQTMDPMQEDSRNFRMPMTFDGKRMRKAVLRKTVDYNASVIKQIQMRKWFKGLSRRNNMQPDESYAAEVLPPSSLIDNPVNAITTKFVRTSTNKLRCPIFCVVWTPEGRRLVTGASSGEFTLWNGLTFNFETILQAHETPVRAMVWSHSDAWLVSSDHGGYIKYWQSNMNNVKMYEAHKEPIRGLSFSPVDNKFASCSDDGLVKVWDFLRCTEEKVLRGHGADVKCLDWHPHKSLLVSGSKDNQQPIKLWDPRTGSGLATLHAHKSTVMSIKWNRNGNWLLTASRDHLIKLFDIRTMKEMQTFRGHKREATTVAWHPIHESLFASGGSDGSLMFWLVGAEKDVGNMDAAHDGMVWSLAWHPLGHILCSGSNDHSSKFWTRNRLGDKMRDKYNLNLQCADDDVGELETSSFSGSSHPSTIPGMDATLTAADMDYPEFDGYDAADKAAKQRGMARKSHAVPAPAWPPASGPHNGVPGVMPGIMASQIPANVGQMDPQRGERLIQGPPDSFNSVGAFPGRLDNRPLRPDAPTFQPDPQYNPRMPTPFQCSTNRFGGPDHSFRRAEGEFGEGRSHRARGSRWGGRVNFKGAPEHRGRRPWGDHQSSSNWPSGPDDDGFRSNASNDHGQQASRGANPSHGHFDVGEDAPGRDFRPGLLGSPPRAHESDNRPGILGPPPQPPSEGSAMTPPGATGNPMLGGSLLRQPPGPDNSVGPEETPRCRSHEVEDSSLSTGAHPLHSQDPRGSHPRAHGQGPDAPFLGDKIDSRPCRRQPFTSRGSARPFPPGSAEERCPEHIRPGRQSAYGDSRDPRSQSQPGEPMSNVEDSRFLGGTPPNGPFDADHGQYDFRGTGQFPSPVHNNPAGAGDTGQGRGPGPSRGLDQNTHDPPGAMGDGKPSIPSLMSINPLRHSPDDTKFGDRDTLQFRGRKRSADGESFRDGDPPRGLPKLQREGDDWRRAPRSNMEGPREEWHGPPTNWQNGRFSDQQYEDPWPKEQFRRDDYVKHGPHSQSNRGGWRGRGGRR